MTGKLRGVVSLLILGVAISGVVLGLVWMGDQETQISRNAGPIGEENTSLPSQPPPVSTEVDSATRERIENRGQTDPQVAFTVQGNDKILFFNQLGLVFRF